MTALRLDRLPVAISLEQYQRAAGRIEEYLLRLPGIVAVYGVGGISAPGISDIDRIAVVDGGGPFRSPWAQLTDEERYTAMHTPFLVDVESFSKHRWFAHLEPLRLLHGEPVEVVEPAQPQPLDRLTGLEGLVLTRLRLTKTCFLQRVAVRPMLCELHNLRHDLRLSGADASSSSRAWAIASDVDRLRKTWWDTRTSDYPRLIASLVIGARDALDETLGRFRHDSRVAGDETFSFNGYWKNVELISFSGPSVSGPGSRLPATSTKRWRRVSEVRWRASSHRVRVSADVIRLLSISRAGEHGVLADRRRYVDRYARFVSSHNGWSSIGFLGLG
jgi:hypothetical protein